MWKQYKPPEIKAARHAAAADTCKCAQKKIPYQFLIEAHLCEILPEDLTIHVDTLLANIQVAIDLRVYALTPCG